MNPINPQTSPATCLMLTDHTPLSATSTTASIAASTTIQHGHRRSKAFSLKNSKTLDTPRLGIKKRSFSSKGLGSHEVIEATLCRKHIWPSILEAASHAKALEIKLATVTQKNKLLKLFSNQSTSEQTILSLYNRHGPLVLSSVLIRLKIPTDSLSKTKLNEALVQQCMNLCLEAQDVLSQQASWMMLAEMRCAYTFLQEQNIDTQRKPRREEGPRYVSPRLRHLLTGLNIQVGDRLTLSEEAAFKILSLAVTISKDPELYMLLADFHYPAGTDILCVAYAISHLHPIISWPSHLTLPPQSAHGLLSIDEQQGIIKNLSLESLFNLTPRFSRTGTFSLRHSISYLLRPSTLSS